MSRRSQSQRQLLLTSVMICLVVWAGTAWIMFGEDAGARVMPGRLTHHHAAFVKDCGHCHDDNLDSFKGFLSGLAHSDMAIKEGRRCLECHELGVDAFRAHGMDSDALARISQEHTSVAGAKPALMQIGLPMNEDGEIACAVCHREHAGANHDLKDVADQACQSCHLDSNDTFPAAHPEFQGFPYAGKNNIRFDHASHQKKNFPDKKAEFNCALCHVTAADGEMTIRPFGESCTSCHHHEEQIMGQGKLQKGIPILTAFGLDLETLAENDLEVEAWPADGADFDNPPTPLTWILVAGDRAYPEAMNDQNTLADVDLSDLSEADRSQMLAAHRLAAAFRRLITRMAHEPRQFLQSLDDCRATSRASQLAARLLHQRAFAGVAESWFGVCGGAEPESVSKEWGGGGHWYVDDETMSLCYVPRGHDDAMLARLHERALQPDGAALRAALMSEKRCFKCHDGAGEDGTMNWEATVRNPATRFTRFDHHPHLLAVGGGECAQCHKLETAGGGSAAPAQGAETAHHHSGFSAMRRQDCARCHSPEQGTSRCVDCHNYHIGYKIRSHRGR